MTRCPRPGLIRPRTVTLPGQYRQPECCRGWTMAWWGDTDCRGRGPRRVPDGRRGNGFGQGVGCDSVAHGRAYRHPHSVPAGLRHTTLKDAKSVPPQGLRRHCPQPVRSYCTTATTRNTDAALPGTGVRGRRCRRWTARITAQRADPVPGATPRDPRPLMWIGQAGGPSTCASPAAPCRPLNSGAVRGRAGPALRVRRGPAEPESGSIGAATTSTAGTGSPSPGTVSATRSMSPLPLA